MDPLNTPFTIEQMFEAWGMLAILLFSLPLLVLYSFLLWATLDTAIDSLKTMWRPFRSTMGVVRARENINGNKPYALYRIAFTHNGQSHEFQTCLFNQSIYSSGAYALNEQVRVYFRENDPQRAVLHLTGPGAGLLMLALCGVLLWVAWMTGSVVALPFQAGS